MAGRGLDEIRALAQRRALDEIGVDLASEGPMHRLLQGEVGSGKTVVAALALFTISGTASGAGLYGLDWNGTFCSIDPATATVRIRDLRVAFGDRLAVAGAGFEIRPGRVTALVGPSGCGKSTILSVLLGLVGPPAAHVSGSVEGRTLLSQFLREDLRLTGTHVGCDTSQCGACVVHVNGAAVKACTMLAFEADGAEVTTIEGLADGMKLDPIQESFMERGAVQCGFCTPGMIMAAYALLRSESDPDTEQIKTALEGNLCRCTGYKHIIDAVRTARARMARNDD